MQVNKKAKDMSSSELAAYIDHAVLKPQFTKEEFMKEVQIGIDHECYSVCVNPADIALAKAMCEGTKTQVCAVMDFPFGRSTTSSKIEQARLICEQGVVEVDMVANYGWIRDKAFDKVEEEVRQIAQICHHYKTGLKVILETDALNLEEIHKAVLACAKAGADFVKSSTGFYTGGPTVGASVEVVKTMLEAAEGKIKVKGSGGIRTKEHFLELIDMGVDRLGLGSSSTPKVLAKD